jgi:hypothetical protein
MPAAAAVAIVPSMPSFGVGVALRVVIVKLTFALAVIVFNLGPFDP